MTTKLDRVSNITKQEQKIENEFYRFLVISNVLLQEIHALRAQLEAAKYDVIKYCIGTLVSISTVGLAVIRILM